MILIISSETDAHARAVMEELDLRGEQYHLLDTGDFPTKATLSIQYDDGGSVVFNYGGERVSLDAVGSVWWRRPQPYRIDEALTDPLTRNFTLGEIDEAYHGVYAMLDAFWINDPARDERAGRKAYQLQLARQLGLRTPRTLITNDPDEARRFITEQGHDRTIYKPFKGSAESWRETRILKREELDLLDTVRYAPLIFQEYVEAVADLRVTAVGGRLFPAAINLKNSSYPQDFRMDMAGCSIAACELPREVEDRLLQLMRRLGLSYGAIDLRLTPDGEYVFLEINPSGQWLFIEVETGQPIARAVAELLIEGRDTHLQSSVSLPSAIVV